MKKVIVLFVMASMYVGVMAQCPGHCYHNPAPQPAPPKMYQASPEQVQAIVDYIEGVNMSADKLKAAKLCTMLCPLQVTDIARVGKLFSMDDDRLEFYKSAYANCSDPQNYLQLRKTLKFSANADNLLDFISEAEKKTR